MNQNPLYTFEGLVSLSINELNLLSESIHTNLENVNSIGVASDKDYIGVEKAQSIAFSHAGITEADVLGLHTKLDYEDGLMVYDVEFYAGEYEYDYEINAKTGDVVKSEKDWEEFPSYTNSSNHTANQGPSNNSSSSSGNTGNTGAATAYMDAAAAKQTVLAHAGVQEADIYDYDVDFDYDHGVAVYELKFKSGGYEYDYKINAQTGEIYKNEKGYDDDYHHSGNASASGNGASNTGNSSSGNSGGTVSSSTSGGTSAAYIDAAAAKQAALSHAGVKEADIREYEIELDYDNGVMVYEIEFKAGNYEYEYEINAETGNVMKNEKDRDD